jgi:hypothetical protein
MEPGAEGLKDGLRDKKKHCIARRNFTAIITREFKNEHPAAWRKRYVHACPYFETLNEESLWSVRFLRDELLVRLTKISRKMGALGGEADEAQLETAGDAAGATAREKEIVRASGARADVGDRGGVQTLALEL